MLLAIASSTTAVGSHRPVAEPSPALREVDAANAATLARQSRDDAAAALPRGAILDALERMLASAAFMHSKRHRTFMRYVVDAALDGHEHRLKEVVIGLDVFGRSLDGYDPGRDSIVRVEIRRVRQKIERYYAGEGRDADLEIGLPIGRYVPTFRARDAKPRRVCLAVLPVRVLHGDGPGRAIGVGIVDQLVDRIGGERKDIRIVAPSLTDESGPAHDADLRVESSIAEFGSRMRCVVRIAHCRQDRHLWSQTFDRGRDEDPFDFQDRIAAAVGDAVTLAVPRTAP